MLRVRFDGSGWGFPGAFAPAPPLEEFVVPADAPENLGALLEWLDEVSSSGDQRRVAAGFLSYEAGVWLEGSRRLCRPPDRTPLAAFALFQAHARPSPLPALPVEAAPARSGPDLDRLCWDARVEEIRGAIARGDVYQVNLTRRQRVGDHPLLPESLAGALYHENPVPYAMTVQGEDWAAVSNSPELFLSVDLRAHTAVSAPIKGTIARAAGYEEDNAAKARLLASEKDAAEHVMIVDLVRNDLGRVASPGGVDVPRFRRVLTLKHLHHLESTVRARLAKGVRLSDVLRATLPAGSITGAPKRAALGLIHRLEPAPRGPYTGALGWVRGDGAAVFSVGIRTAVVSAAGVEYHAGGGIVWDSDPAAEWEETVTKSREMGAAVRSLVAAGA